VPLKTNQRLLQRLVKQTATDHPATSDQKPAKLAGFLFADKPCGA
jgi:hypothetical protein